MPWRATNTRAAGLYRIMYEEHSLLEVNNTCVFSKNRNNEQRRRLTQARNREQAQLGTFVIRPCPPTDQRRRARGL